VAVGGTTWVRGTAGSANPSVYFRIGLKSTWGGSAPRYGLVLLQYKNNTLNQRIWIRQGDSDDYAPGQSSGTQWSPYNLGNANNFMSYPTQAGYYYQWINAMPFNPIDPPDIEPAGWNSSLTGTYSLGGVSPTGYTLPVGTDMDNMLNTSIVEGYYADGFFDRRQIVSSITYIGLDSKHGNSNLAPPYDKTAVSFNPANYSDPQNTSVAYMGILFFSPTNNASIFFPASGYRWGGPGPGGPGSPVNSDLGELWFAGREGGYWAQTAATRAGGGGGSTTAPSLSLYTDGSGISVGGYWVNIPTLRSGLNQGNYAYPIRCIRQ